MGSSLVKPCHITFVCGLWNDTPNFNKYWKIPAKIIFLTLSQYAFLNLIKKTYFHYIFYSCIFSFEFLYSFIYLPSILTWHPSYDPHAFYNAPCLFWCRLWMHITSAIMQLIIHISLLFAAYNGIMKLWETTSYMSQKFLKLLRKVRI